MDAPPCNRVEPGIRLKIMHIWLSKALTLLTFCLIPFLGGNDLALFYVNIDRFWIENLFAVFLILAVVLLHMGNNRQQHSFLRFLGYFLPFFAITVISLTYSWNLFGSLGNITCLIWAAGCVYLFLVSPWKELCLAGLVAGATGCAISAVLQHLILFPKLTSVFQQSMYAHALKDQSGIPFASFSHHNMLGGYLAIVFPLSVYFAIGKKGAIVWLMSIAASALMVTGLVLSSKQIGMGLVILSLLITSIVVVFTIRDKVGAIKLCAIVALAVLICFSVLYAGNKQQRQTGVQAVTAPDDKTAYKDLSTLNTRTEIWRNAFNAFKNRPSLGYGAGSFEYAYRKYFDGGSYAAAAHSWAVKTAVELGVVGLLCFCFYLFGVARHIRGSSLNSFMAPLLLCSCFSLIFGLIDFSFDVAAHVITFFVITGGFFSWKTGSVDAVPKPHKGVVLFLLVIVALLGTLLFNVRSGMMKGDLAYGDMLHENGLGMGALSAYRDAMKYMPLSPEPYIKASAVLREGIPARKSESDRKAMTVELKEYLGQMEKTKDHNAERYLALGLCFEFLGEKAKGELYLKEAMDSYPSSPEFAYEVACYYLSIKQYESAIRYVRAFEQYVPKFRIPHNPREIFVYRIHDLAAQIEHARGNPEKALEIAERNLKEAEESAFVVTTAESGGYTSKKSFLKYLRQRVEFYSHY